MSGQTGSISPIETVGNPLQFVLAELGDNDIASLTRTSRTMRVAVNKEFWTELGKKLGWKEPKEEKEKYFWIERVKVEVVVTRLAFYSLDKSSVELSSIFEKKLFASKLIRAKFLIVIERVNNIAFCLRRNIPQTDLVAAGVHIDKVEVSRKVNTIVYEIIRKQSAEIGDINFLNQWILKRDIFEVWGELVRAANLPYSESRISTFTSTDYETVLQAFRAWLENKSKDLEEVKYLNLKKKKLSYLPGELAKLTNLEIISLDGNNLVQIPEWLKTLAKLKTIEVDDNRVTKNSEVLKKLESNGVNVTYVSDPFKTSGNKHYSSCSAISNL